MKSVNAVLRIVTAVVLMGIAGATAAQQPYPSKPIRFILPNSAGASNDFVVRLIGPKLTDSLGQPLIIDHRPGGNYVIANEALVKSAPDGHTILLVTATHSINPLLFPNQPYHPIKDFAPVATLVSSTYVLVLNNSVPANNLQEFIALAKAKPGQLNCASASTGGIQHLALELFNALAGVKLQHVPYKGIAPGMVDLIGGQVQLAFSSSITVMPHVRSGKLKAIGVGSETRLSVLPEVPTFKEAGLPGFSARNWFGVVAPARTPREIVERLAAEIAKAQQMPDVREKLAGLGVEPLILGPDQFTALIKSDMAKYAKVIKDAKIKIED